MEVFYFREECRWDSFANKPQLCDFFLHTSSLLIPFLWSIYIFAILIHHLVTKKLMFWTKNGFQENPNKIVWNKILPIEKAFVGHPF